VGAECTGVSKHRTPQVEAFGGMPCKRSRIEFFARDDPLQALGSPFGRRAWLVPKPSEAAAEAFVPTGRWRRRPQAKRASRAQANDKRLSLQVREALVEIDAAAVVHVSPHVYMDRVFLVGFVENEDQRSRLQAAAKAVEGIRKVDGYLPLKSADALMDGRTTPG
jgi:hypothetical protein